MWKPLRRGLAYAGIGIVLAMSGCTSSESGDSDVSSSDIASETSTASATASPEAGMTASPIEPSLPAGIPTSEPSTSGDGSAQGLDASAFVTLATADPNGEGFLVGGFVSGVAEDGGTCNFELTSASGNIVSEERMGIENNGSTSCGSSPIPSERLAPGDYTVTLRYSNSRGEVTSEPVEVTVP